MPATMPDQQRGKKPPRRVVTSVGLREFAWAAVAVIVLTIVLETYVLKPYNIASGSMEPTMRGGDAVLVDRFAHTVLGHDPKLGDVVVFHPPEMPDPNAPKCAAAGEGEGTDTPCSKAIPEQAGYVYAKRVVGVGGDEIAIRDGRVVRNGKLADEGFITRCAPDQDCDFPNPITVPKGYMFVLGDNRNQTDDSRAWGPIPMSWVVGKPLVRLWPLSRLGGVG